MGSPVHEPGRNEDELEYEVVLTRGFHIQTTPVTQAQWKAMMGKNPSGFQDRSDDLPVERVSWYQCQEFIKKLNSSGDFIYRLPTEAEWEYACRSGSVTPFANGDIVELFCTHDPNLNAIGWYCGNSARKTHSVGQKSPNTWGLYDMHGNVCEWCEDWYAEYPSTSQKDPRGPSSGQGRVIRGGSWFSNAKNCRSAARLWWAPNSASDFIGFRLVREPR
jgi:formylglycine-generating enzyme required for sulfatase activity